ncbi:YdeI/OmpD-associated family protein [Rhizobium sp. LCM 4573]|uniref:YdeI/OmpD-associated family protein n=1 Tax=Rhizobium sp. LCM 4573 TaxID=1848291 RepID=UPI0008D94EA8|nr:YdeI/OmpD-associated family protein [Rhizobium sp. LCM 4573]OHV76002.1 hypothetical protein LCM4573_15250 [Rhizobium sp. LCM 4573]
MRKSFTTVLGRDGPGFFIILPFDPKPIFGKVRAPVKVTVNGYTYRSTVSAMGGMFCLPLRKSHREVAGVKDQEELQVTLELDTEERTVETPKELAEALERAGCRGAWERLSYTQRREDAEAVIEAKRPETRVRRIKKIVERMKPV